MSTVIQTEHTMIALFDSPTAMSVSDFGLPARRTPAATLSKTIWRLHWVIINWDSKSDDVKAAKRRLLRVPEARRRLTSVDLTLWWLEGSVEKKKALLAGGIN